MHAGGGEGMGTLLHNSLCFSKLGTTQRSVLCFTVLPLFTGENKCRYWSDDWLARGPRVAGEEIS